MLDFQRLGKLTAELSANLVQSIVLPRRGQPRLNGNPANRRLSQASPRGRFVLAPELLNDDQVLAVIHLAGGRDIKVAVIPAAAENYREAGEVTGRAFRRYGITNVESLEVVTRERADNPFWAEKVLESDVLVLSDGEARRAIGILEGTMVESSLEEALRRGKIVVGCGAGAYLLGEVVIEQGDAAAPAVPEAGLSFLPGISVVEDILDPAAMAGLVSFLASNAERKILSIGLDRAALVVTGEAAEVVGEGVVTVIDGRGAELPGQLTGEGSGAISGLRLHRLVAGQYLNLVTGRPGGWRSPKGEKVVGSST